MSRRARKVPSYCLHKASGKAVVRLDGRDVYLGKHGSPESHEKYERAIAEWRIGHNGSAVSPGVEETGQDPLQGSPQADLAYQGDDDHHDGHREQRQQQSGHWDSPFLVEPKSWSFPRRAWRTAHKKAP